MGLGGAGIGVKTVGGTGVLLFGAAPGTAYLCPLQTNPSLARGRALTNGTVTSAAMFTP